MTDYRIVARHVRYWRGAVHKWSTVYPLTGTISSGNYAAVIAAAKVLEQGVNFKNATGATAGGLYEIALYDHATGGIPVALVTYFDPTVPAGWVAYTGAGWSTAPAPVCSNAEVALQVEWLAGLSSSGKPVKFRKWYHAVPDAVTIGTRDVVAADVTALQTFINTNIAVIGGLGAVMGNSSRLAATTCQVLQFYGNHQMPRGRRRKPLVTADGRYTGPTIRVTPPVIAD